MVNNPLIRPYFLGVGIGGVPLDSHYHRRFGEASCFSVHFFGLRKKT